ncbi:DUF7716 domain-containing protein [Gilliamella sp. Fer4-1]|uniref:DUF7716 domain-containing protein n=1 Tax=Gilliamella sp. Fer4-1 TaxID=3120242 RepID=UPI00080E2AFD|nr:hypothetical protein [Gilliamella apicola]OCG56927.1 hypothetical protein A9G30_01940 [Gilliamella apicola]
MDFIAIRDVLSNIKDMPNHFFYLPADHSSWTLDTQGRFLDDDALNYFDSGLSQKAIEEDWIPTLEKADIEDIIEVANNELGNPTLEDLFNSFIFYIENDAFLQYAD